MLYTHYLLKLSTSRNRKMTTYLIVIIDELP